MTKVANVILYMLHKQVKHLNDKKLSVLLFMMDYNHLKFCESKIFGEEYIKGARQPELKVLSELFEIIANEEDLDEEDTRLYLIQEILDYLDIEITPTDKYTELSFIKMEEEFDEELFTADELKTIYKVVALYQETSPRNVANECFKLEDVRKAQKGEVII